MNWKYEFIDITLILTLNDDILVTLNDLILTSTILVNLVILLVHHVSSRQRTIAKYMLVSAKYMLVHVTNQLAMAACSDNIYGMVPLFVTQNQAIIVQYELACVPDCFV
jgi:hypothetical protein